MGTFSKQLQGPNGRLVLSPAKVKVKGYVVPQIN
jgi:hypothetical protein